MSEFALDLTDMRLQQTAATIRMLMADGHGDSERLSDALWAVAQARAIVNDLILSE